MVIIRPALSKDLGTVHALGSAVSEFSVNDKTVNFWPESVLQNAIKSTDTLVYVAEESDKLVGFIIASYVEGLKKSTVENIFVAHESRNKGIGNMLLEKLLSELAQKGCQYVAALIPVEAIGAAELYKNAGFSVGETFVWLDRPFSRQLYTIAKPHI